MRRPAFAVAAMIAAAGPAMAEGGFRFSEDLVIRRHETAHEWPFSVDEGELNCIAVDGQKFVFFAEMLAPEKQGGFGSMVLPRRVVVSANPVALLASLEDRALYAPYEGLETLIKRLAPFERMGRALCDKAEGKGI
jgi:hypothetical protein